MGILYISITSMLWIVAVLLIQSNVANSSAPFSTDQISQQTKQKVIVDLDVGLTMVDSLLERASEDLEIFQTVKCKNCKQNSKPKWKIIKKITMIAKNVSPYMKVASLGFAVAKFGYSILHGSKIDEKLNSLNDKLDNISKQINYLGEEIKASIEFNDWLTYMAKYEANIRGGEAFLNATLNEMKATTDDKFKMKVANAFLNFYETNQIEVSAEEIHRLTGKPPSITSPNLFDIFVKEKGCDIVEISGLMMILRELMTSVSKQSMVYYFFKDGNEDRVGKYMTKYETFIYDIRDYYNNHVWYCFRDFKDNAMSTVEKTIVENNQNKGIISSVIHDKLSSLIPWYSWTVAKYDENQAPSVNVHGLLGSHRVEFTAEGETYFLLENYIVVWQDNEDVFRSCSDIEISSTKVYFRPCKECSSESFVKSDNMKDEHYCNDYLNELVRKAADENNFRPNGVLSNLAKHPVSFITADIGNHDNACVNNPCLNEGLCKPIEYTNERFCMCKPFFEGVNCENDVGNDLADNVTAVLSQLREHFGIMTGIPDIIDIYFQINDLATDIKNMQKSLQYYSEYGNLITLYGKSIKEAEYISNYHSDFQNEKLKVQNFGRIIDKFDFDYILLDFSQMITGDTIMVEDDFLTSKKKTLSVDLGACTEKYSNAVKSLMRNLVTLDQVVVESMLWHARWKLNNTQSIYKKRDILSDVYQTYEYSIERQKLYYDNWNDKSCPSLNVKNGKISDYESIHCDKGLSYEGLSLKVQCMDYALKADNHYNVTCLENENGTLEWAGIPECEFEEVWGNWTDWTECSVTCDNGIKYSFQRSNKGHIKNKTQTCDNNGVKCCTESNGAHICPNGLCIWPDKLCDGVDDCGDNEDEETCRYLRVGDTVAIKSPCGKWLSCARGEHGNKCNGDGCGGDYMHLTSEHDDWHACSSQVYNYVAAEGRVKDQAIRHGDRVALRYGYGDGYWLTCQNSDYCQCHNCPGSTFDDNEFSSCTGEVYWILSDARKGNCDFKTSPGCIGDPIQPFDTIYLLHDAGSTGQWVSGDNHHTRLRTCDVRNDIGGCQCERWEISIKKYA